MRQKTKRRKKSREEGYWMNSQADHESSKLFKKIENDYSWRGKRRSGGLQCRGISERERRMRGQGGRLKQKGEELSGEKVSKA